MAVTLRLVRFGRRNRAFFRLRAAESQYAPTGRFIEDLGTVDPLEKDASKKVALNRDRIEHWLSVGAQTSETVRTLLNEQGIGRGRSKQA